MTEKRNERSSRMPGFYKLSIRERLDKLDEFAELTTEERYILRREPIRAEDADLMVENVVGVMGMPFGVALNFRINERDYVVPMVTEESSVIAAASHLAMLVRNHGELTAECDDSIMIGQIQITDLEDAEAARKKVLNARDKLLSLADEQDPVLVRHGGGARGMETHILKTDQGDMLVIHLLVDARDAMGANAVNTMAEAVAPVIEEITDGKALLRIISNLSDRRLARAKLVIDPEAFAEHGRDGDEVADGILKACAFAAADPYRAATHNKGVMNGIDALAIATGNDWRAIEAGAHAYACRDGKYSPLSRWSRDDNGNLVGEIELPLPLGIVGGATKVNHTARIALKILGVESANELSSVAAAVGLTQNLAAMRSLVAEGIQKGHMVLHARNIAVSAGAVGELASRVANQMVREGRIGFERASQIVQSALKRAQRGVHDFRVRVEKAGEEPPVEPKDIDETPPAADAQYDEDKKD